MAFNWTCPHCDRAQTVTAGRISLSRAFIGVPEIAEGAVAFERTAIGCSNPECQKLTVSVRIGVDRGGDGWAVDPQKVMFSERLIPRGTARPQPEYVPAVLRDDYYEACLIRDLSPKASATLARRCRQGMIRDFCKISRGRLIDEVQALTAGIADGTADRAITEESVKAIDHVRSLGNIGAHFEKDIDLIIEVDAEEAQVMIELIEMLFDDWYGERHRRNLRLAKIEEIKSDKEAQRTSANSTARSRGNAQVARSSDDVAVVST